MTEQSPQATPRRGVSRRLLVLGLVMVVAIAFMIWFTVQGAAVYYETVGEVLANPEAFEGRPIRVQGTFADGSILQDETRLWINFELTDGVQRIPVVYESTPPDLLGYSTEDRYQDVIVEGSLDAAGILQARQLLVQHGADFESVDEFADGG